MDNSVEFDWAGLGLPVSPLSSHSHVSQFASSRSQISPSTYLCYFFWVRSLFLTANNNTHCCCVLGCNNNLSLTGGGGGGQAGVAGHGEPEHPVQLHLVPVHLLLLLLPLERPEPPDVGGAIAGRLLPPVALVRGEGAWGSALRLHPGSYLDDGPGKGSLLSEEKRLSGSETTHRVCHFVSLKSLTLLL